MLGLRLLAGDAPAAVPALVRRGLIAVAVVAGVGCAPVSPATEPAPRPAETAAPAAPAPVTPTMPSAAPITPVDSARVALGPRRLLVPVAGVDPHDIPDSFRAPRGARTHGAVDIMAPRGTPVVSADSGSVLRVSENRAGGLTVYAVDPERRLVYYYAHMDGYADGIAPGRALSRGDTIGFVGTTGNAPRDIPHLHFQIMLMHPAGRYWAGTPVDPLPLLRAATTAADEPDE